MSMPNITSGEQFAGQLSLTAAAKIVPGRPHRNTLWRWARKGVRARNGKRIRLGHIRCGKRILTSPKAIMTFAQELAEADLEGLDAPAGKRTESRCSASDAARTRAIQRAERRLAAEGIIDPKSADAAEWEGL